MDVLGRGRAAPPGRSALLVEAVEVPRHRDRCPVDRRVVVQPAALPGPAQAGGVRVRLARRGDDRVLALAHAAVRHRDLLGRRAAAQPRAGTRVPRGRRARRRARRRSARRSTATSPTRTSRSSGRTTAASPSSSSRRSRHPTASPIARRTSASSTRSTAASSTPARSRASCTCRRRTPWARPNSPRGSRCSSHPGCTSQPTPTSTSCATTRRRAATSSSASARATATRRRGRGSRSHRRGSTRPRASGTTSSRTWATRCRSPRPGRSRHPPAAPHDSGPTGSSARAPRRSPRYDHPRFSDFPAVTTNAHGSGRITVVGTVPSPALAADLVRWAVPSPVADGLAPGRALPVTVASGSLPDGRRAWFVFNWGWEPQAITLAASVADPVTGDHAPDGHRCLTAGLVGADLRRSVSTKGSCDPTQPQKESS